MKFARQEVADADARRKAEAEARVRAEVAEAKREKREARREEERRERRERRSRRLRGAGNVAAAIAILAAGAFGVERVMRWTELNPGHTVFDRGSWGADTDGESDGAETPGAARAGQGRVVLPPAVGAEVPAVEDPGAVPASADPRLRTLDQLADSTIAAMTAFRAAAASFEAELIDCEDLRAAFSEVGRLWLTYAVNGVSPLESGLDEERSARHENLAQDANGIEVAYEVSGCPMP